MPVLCTLRDQPEGKKKSFYLIRRTAQNTESQRQSKLQRTADAKQEKEKERICMSTVVDECADTA